MQCWYEPCSGAADPVASSFSRRRHIDLQRVASCLCHA
ncbi:putative leader peptide [Actinospica durhamensis]